MTCTKEEALEQFVLDLEKFEKEIEASLPGTRLNQHQFDAIVSFCYNCGTGAFRKSTLRKKIIAYPGNNDGIKKEFSRWNKAGGVVSNGLKKRRSIEAAWYIFGPEYEKTIKNTVAWMYGMRL